MIASFGRLLARYGIRYLIVGGQAIAREIPTATQDIDALVLVPDLDAAVEILSKDSAVKHIDSAVSGMAGGAVRLGGAYIDFDLLDPTAYSGKESGRVFFSYAARRASPDGYATPPVVWYMRLVAGDIGIYGSKIATDIRNGAPVGWLDDVRRIARRFGTLEPVDTGIQFVAQLLEITRPARSVLDQ